MKICFIGSCGHALQAYRQMQLCESAEFVGIAPGSSHEALSALQKFNLPIFASYQEMIRLTQPDVAVVSPVFGLTGRIIRFCAEHKIHVFSEKPIAGDPDELDQIRQIVHESGIRFSAMHFLRFTPSFYHAKKMVESGIIGDIRMVTAQKSYKYGTRPDWYQDRSLYTGTIPWVGIHAIDWIHFFCPKKFLSVKALHVGQPEMTALCQFELEDSVLAAANLDYYRPDGAPSHGDDRVRVVGTGGIIEVFEDRFVVMTQQNTREYRPSQAPKLAYDFLLGQEELSADEVFMLTKVALLARESADTHTVINLEERL